MGTHRLATTKHNNMKVLILVCSLVASIYAEADADALYGAYGAYGHGAYGGAALGYPYAYARGYAAPALGAYRRVAAARTVVAPAVHAVAAAPAVHAAPVVAEVRAAVPTVTSTQFHSQDEAKSYAFGYSNINSARQESGNALTGVTGSYSDGFRTYNYVADGLGFRHV